jgi:hypothetical protein
MGGLPVRVKAAVNLLAGTISGTGTSASNDGYGTAQETMTLSGKLDPATGAISASIKSRYSYAIDADNTWIKSYTGKFTAKMRTFDMWVGTGTFTFGTVKRVGSVGNEVPVQGRTYESNVQIQITSGRLDLTPPETIEARVTSVGGEVKYSQDGGKTFQPLTRGTILPQGAVVLTGFDAWANLDFGYGTVSIPQTVRFRLDEYTSSANLRRTQLYLNIGTIQPRIKHTNAGRSDFSVITPTAHASIRGSAMVVSVAPDTGVTTVWVTEDAAFVQGTADAAEVEVPAGQRVVVGADGHAGAPAPFQPSELPSVPAAPAGATTPPVSGGSSGGGDGTVPVGPIAGAVLAIGALALVFLGAIRRRGGRAQGGG